MMESSSTLADDVLRGAEAIATELFGDAKERRRVYYLVEKHQLPVFRLGGLLCARKTTLRRWIEEQEAKSVAGNPQ